MSLSFCYRCKCFHESTVPCTAKFEVKIPLYDMDWYTIYGPKTKEEAAECACENIDDEGDCPIISHGFIDEVLIREIENPDVVYMFSVVAQAEPAYYSKLEKTIKVE